MNLAEWMKATGHNDAKLAAKLGSVSRSQISRIRRFKSIPSPDTAKALAEYTKLPAEALLFVERAA